MESTREAYYGELARDYERTIRQLVPRHDEMVDAGIEALRGRDARRLLDLGCGNGGVTRRLLDALPGAAVVAVEGSGSMLERARQTLSSGSGRVTLLRGDLREVEPEGSFDAVYSNLVLHNVPPGPRAALLRRIAGWLEPGGVFVWGDLIRFDDPATQERWVTYRREHALASGCPGELVEWNFRKEGAEDFPPTREEACAAGRAAGFAACDVVWAHDTFAVFRLEAPGGD